MTPLPSLLHSLQPTLRQEPVLLGQGHSIPLVVTHQKKKKVPLSDIVPQAGSHLASKGTIQSREGFVQEEKLGRRQERPTQGHPLLFSAGKPPGHPLQKVVHHEKLPDLLNFLGTAPPKLRFSRTLRWGKRRYSCGTHPTLRSQGGRKIPADVSSQTFPPTFTTPLALFSTPARTLSSVLFPPPEEPKTTTAWEDGIQLNLQLPGP